MAPTPQRETFKQWLSRVIFETDTWGARAFDIGLLVAILVNTLLVIIETIHPVKEAYGTPLRIAEWGFTLLFTAEYLLRLYLANHTLRYSFSFFGIIDLLAILPTYIELFITGSHYLAIIRATRLLRLFRVFKLTRYIRAATNIRRALRASGARIVVFLGTVTVVVLLIGSVMYLIEGPENGFTNIPVSMYWAINTITPISESTLKAKTILGRGFAALLMIAGYAILAIPTGIVSSEITRVSASIGDRVCDECQRGGHREEAHHCYHCGAVLPPPPDKLS
jgi:voltage-gated potassium channel